MPATHNHPPRCCCESDTDPTGSNERLDCPMCIEHGELIPAVECPQCHQLPGRPHTEFCVLAPGDVWDGVMPTARVAVDTGTMFADVPAARPACAYPRRDHGDGRGCDADDCPRHGNQ